MRFLFDQLIGFHNELIFCFFVLWNKSSIFCCKLKDVMRKLENGFIYLLSLFHTFLLNFFPCTLNFSANQKQHHSVQFKNIKTTSVFISVHTRGNIQKFVSRKISSRSIQKNSFKQRLRFNIWNILSQPQVENRITI